MVQSGVEVHAGTDDGTTHDTGHRASSSPSTHHMDSHRTGDLLFTPGVSYASLRKCIAVKGALSQREVLSTTRISRDPGATQLGAR